MVLKSKLTESELFIYNNYILNIIVIIMNNLKRILFVLLPARLQKIKYVNS